MGPSSTELDAIARQLFQGSMAASTKVMYDKVWAMFHSFVGEQTGSELRLPVDRSLIVRFIAWLYSRGYSYSTIATYISAVSFLHKMHGFPDFSKDFVIQKVLIGSKKAGNQVDNRLPLTKELVDLLCHSVPKLTGDDYLQALIRAMFLTAFYGFLRVGEIAVSQDRGAVIQRRDIELVRGQQDMLRLTIRSYKHDQGKGPHTLFIAPLRGEGFCPVQAMLKFIKVRGDQQGPLFGWVTRGVQQSTFRSWLKTCVCLCGLDPTRYKGHSFRIGAASSAAAQGCTETQIKALGRWNSDAFKRYIRPTSTLANPLNTVSPPM